MLEYLRKKIEEVRQEPENVRHRYVFLCLITSMLFILGIWLLSVKEGYSTLSDELPRTIDQGRKNVAPLETPSLNDLMSESVPLRVENNTQQENFFESQLQLEGRNTDGNQ